MVDIHARHWPVALGYAEAGARDDSPEGEDVRAACRRFLADLSDPRWTMSAELPEFLILSIETLFVHRKGEAIDAAPLLNTPFRAEKRQDAVCDGADLGAGSLVLTVRLVHQNRLGLAPAKQGGL